LKAQQWETKAGFVPQSLRHDVRSRLQILQSMGSEQKLQSGHCARQAHQESASLHWVVELSQVMEVPATLVQEFTGVQLRVAMEQVVVHVVAKSGVGAPMNRVTAMTARRAERVKSLRILTPPLFLRW
jgi:hypothetical protein